MGGIVVAVLLISSLLLVHFSLRRRPMPKTRPLDVDDGLPLPEVGQASTVFSLTALFGAYLGIHMLLGLPALLGLATGTIIALFTIRNWIENRPESSFDTFLFGFFGERTSNAAVFALTLAGIQCAFATSELLILQNVANLSLGLRSDHATLLVITLGVIAYFYVLFGGYMAVFRTDVLQFVLVAAMGLVILSAHHPPARGWAVTLLPRRGYWPLLSFAPGPILYCYHFLIGAVMGLGFLVASPDAWKRVFLLTSVRKPRGARFLIFVAVGTAPFLVLIPMGRASAPLPDGPVNTTAMWSGILASNLLFVATALGLIASFLSAFNGALLASVHLGLVTQRRLKPAEDERPRFHWLMASSLLILFFLFASIRTLGNPYILANLLLGPYAAVAGILVAARGKIQRLRDGSLLWLLVVSFVGWFMYFVASVGFPAVPTTYQVNTVPGGVLLFLVTALISRILTIGGGQHA